MEIHKTLRALAAAQHGLVTRADAVKCGLTAQQIGRRLASGEFQRMHENVYRIAGAPPSRRQALLAACLAGDRLTVASHRSAGELWGLAGVHGTQPEVLVVTRGRPRLEGVRIHRTDLLDAEDMDVIDGIPVTAVPRTIMDLGAVLRPERVESAMEDAVLRLGYSVNDLRSCLDRLAASGRNGCGVLRAILDARDPALAPTDGELEAKLARLIRRYELPAPVRQFRIDTPGRPPIIIDFAYPQWKLAIEADSRRWHAGRLDVQRNSEKQNTLTRLGWLVLRFTWFDVTKRPDQVANDILRSLARASR
jgi:very-short-patch-repair endonuclease